MHRDGLTPVLPRLSVRWSNSLSDLAILRAHPSGKFAQALENNRSGLCATVEAAVLPGEALSSRARSGKSADLRTRADLSAGRWIGIGFRSQSLVVWCVVIVLSRTVLAVGRDDSRWNALGLGRLGTYPMGWLGEVAQLWFQIGPWRRRLVWPARLCGLCLRASGWGSHDSDRIWITERKMN